MRWADAGILYRAVWLRWNLKLAVLLTLCDTIVAIPPKPIVAILWNITMSRNISLLALALVVALNFETTAQEKQTADVPAARKKRNINSRFLDPKLDVDEWIGKFEIESRETYAARERVLAACQLKPGMKVADIGAGTGFYCRLFSSAVGKDGWVYAVDISPRFLEHINKKSEEEDIENITSILGTEKSTRLPKESVDLIFTCDTYHHFSHPASTLASIHAALKPGGTLVLIDFERIPGESRRFILGHVRAGKKVFRQEVLDAGFELIEEVDIPSFKENYLLRFRKK